MGGGSAVSCLCFYGAIHAGTDSLVCLLPQSAWADQIRASGGKWVGTRSLTMNASAAAMPEVSRTRSRSEWRSHEPYMQSKPHCQCSISSASDLLLVGCVPTYSAQCRFGSSVRHTRAAALRLLPKPTLMLAACCFSIQPLGKLRRKHHMLCSLQPPVIIN